MLQQLMAYNVFAVAVIARAVVAGVSFSAVISGRLTYTTFESMPRTALLVLLSLVMAVGMFSYGSSTPEILVATFSMIDALVFFCLKAALDHLGMKIGTQAPINISSRVFGVVLSSVAFKCTCDIYIFAIGFFSTEPIFYVCVVSQGIFSACLHYLLYDVYLCHKDSFGELGRLNKEEEDECEIMIGNYLDKRGTVSDELANHKNVLSFPSMAVRNLIKIVLHGSGLHLSHDVNSLEQDKSFAIDDKSDGKVNMDEMRKTTEKIGLAMKSDFDRYKRNYRSTSDRDFRAILFTSCIFPSLFTVQRIKATRGLLTKFIRQTSMRFHDDEETSRIRARLLNLDDFWFFRARAAFIISIERLVQGFPTLWCPREDFLAQCENMVNRTSFNCNVDIRFYFIEASRSGKMDLQPHLLEDLCVKEQIPDENGNARKHISLYVPLKALALSEKECDAMKREGSHTDDEIQHILALSEEEAMKMKMWRIQIGEVSPVKAGRLAATSFMRHCVFFEAHEALMNTKKVEPKAGSRLTKRRRSGVSIKPVVSSPEQPPSANRSGRQLSDSLSKSEKPKQRRRSTVRSLIVENLELPYRESDNERGVRAQPRKGLDEVSFSERLEKSPENILSSLVLTGHLNAEDMKKMQYRIKFDSSTFFDVHEDQTIDKNSNQKIHFITTDEKKFVEGAVRKKTRRWQHSARLTSAAFTFIDLVCITMTFFEDYSQAPSFVMRVNEVYKYISVVVWLILLYARYAYTEDAIERMTFMLGSIVGENDLRMIDVAMSHVSFSLSHNLSKCSMFYLYGRGGPGLITTGMFLMSILYTQRGEKDDDSAEGAGGGEGSCEKQSMELVTLSAMVLSFITALSWSKAKLLNLYSNQQKTSLDHLNSIFQTNLTKASMDNISDPDYMVSVLSDPDVVALPDLFDLDLGKEFLKSEMDNCSKAVSRLTSVHSSQTNKYVATFRELAGKTNHTGGSSQPKEFSNLNSSRNSKRNSQRNAVKARRKNATLFQGARLTTDRNIGEEGIKQLEWQDEGDEADEDRSISNGFLKWLNPYGSGSNKIPGKGMKASLRRSLMERSASKKRAVDNGNDAKMDAIKQKLNALLQEDEAAASKNNINTEASIAKKMDFLLKE